MQRYLKGNCDQTLELDIDTASVRFKMNVAVDEVQ